MRNFRELTEAKETVVFGFGRFNPPTIGHEKLIEKVASVAGSNPFFIYPSHTQGPKDPLPHAKKVAWMRKLFPKYKRNIIADRNAKTAIQIAEKLYKDGYKNLIMVAGSDRLKEFETLLTRYNDAPDKKGNQLFKFDSVKIVSAGERDPDAEGVAGMSASKMRKAASDGKFDDFKTGIPATLSDADKKKLYFEVRKNMGIREDRDMGDMTDYEELRDAYLTGKIWNTGDIVEANGVVGEIVRKGTNYLSIADVNGKVYKAWLHEIELDERNYQEDKEEDELQKTMKVATAKMGFAKRINQVRKQQKSSLKRVKDKDKKTSMKKTQDTQIKDIKKVAQSDLKRLQKEDRNYRKEYDDYQGTPEQIARRSSRNKARRVMGDKTKIGMDVGHADNDPMNNDPTNLRNEDPSKNRREPRLRESDESEMYRLTGKALKAIPGSPRQKAIIKQLNVYRKKMGLDPLKEAHELDEVWWDKAIAKLSQISHPRDYGKMVKAYAELMKQSKYKKHPNMAADKIAREYSGVSVREFIKYINTLVAKKILPQELKAEIQVESFKDFIKQINEKLSTNASQEDYIDDFINSDAPQFAGKSKKERISMAIAAFRSKMEKN